MHIEKASNEINHSRLLFESSLDGNFFFALPAKNNRGRIQRTRPWFEQTVYRGGVADYILTLRTGVNENPSIPSNV